MKNLVYRLQLQVKSFVKNSFMSCQRGFTIVELLIYMGILSIILGILSMIFVQIIDSQLESQATSSVEQDSRFLLSRFMYDINHASSIVSPALGATSNSFQIVREGVTYTYSINGNNDLQVATNTETDTLNGYDTSVSGLSFQQLGKLGGENSVRIELTLTSRTLRKSGPETRNVQTTVSTR